MVIAKTASRNVAFKAARLGDSIFECQSEILTLATNQVPEEFFEIDEWKQLKEALKSAPINGGIDATSRTKRNQTRN